MRPRSLLYLCLGLVGLGLGLAWRAPRIQAPGAPVGPTPVGDYEAWARARFRARHPREKPLNWAIGEAAMRFHRTHPMGRFVLHRNDCSDFGECAIDEGLGVGARFRRNSTQHLVGAREDVIDCLEWSPGVPAQPGDLVWVAHSPWYPPRAGSIGHAGVVGTDGMVYDFVKLRRWRTARYTRHSFDWFVRHSRAAGETVLARLKPEYRYRVRRVGELGRMGERESGRVGEWESGRVGEWESGGVGERVNG